MSLVFGDSQKRITWQKACRCWSSDHLLDPPRGLFFLCLTQRCFAVQLWCLWLLWVQAIRRLQYKFHLYFYNRKLKLQNGVKLCLLQHTFVCAWTALVLTWRRAISLRKRHPCRLIKVYGLVAMNTSCTTPSYTLARMHQVGITMPLEGGQSQHQAETHIGTLWTIPR